MGINQHLIALDLDGTLLQDNKKIDSQTIAYLKKLKQDHRIILASGRPYRAIIKYYNQLQLDTPIVAYNGAYVSHPHDNDFSSSTFAFPQAVVKAIITDLGPTIIDNVMCETNDTIWLVKEEHDLEGFFWHTNMDIVYGPIQETLHANPMTMILQSVKRSPALDAKIRAAVSRHPGLKMRFWGDSLFSEVYFSHVSKGAAIENILDYYAIPRSQMIAIGDAENDVEMLKLAGTSMAMKQASLFMQSQAKQVTQFDHNHQGVLHALKSYFK
jgi:Cof subfamily protein (haloacid dehalogenase superfamily)